MRGERTEGEPRGDWLRVLLAPWLGIFRPAAAAETLIAAQPRRFWAVYVLHVLALATIVVWLAIWNATVQQTWIPPPTPPTSAPATSLPALGYALGWQSELRTRTAAEVWRDWHADGLIGPAELIFFWILVVTGVGTAFLAWLNLPRLHRAGPVPAAFSQSFRTVASAGGLLTVLATLAGAMIVLAIRADRLNVGVVPGELIVVLVIGIPAGVVALLQRIGRAVASVGERPFVLQAPPRCEGCGYDLTHQAPEALCPECGGGVGRSLSPDRRPGVDWELRKPRRLGDWLGGAWAVMREPRAFYAKLRLRAPIAAGYAFAVRTYVYIGVAAAAWALLMIGVSQESLRWQETVTLTLTAALGVPLICWFGHRLGGAIAITWWIFRRSLPDTRWAAKVLAYEAAFLWVFCAYWGVLATSFVVADAPWISEVFGTQFFFAVFGVPGEPAAVFAGTGLLALLWLWRYAVALRSIRWSNF